MGQVPRAGPAPSARLESKVGVNRLLNWPHVAKTHSNKGRNGGEVNKEISHRSSAFSSLKIPRFEKIMVGRVASVVILTLSHSQRLWAR